MSLQAATELFKTAMFSILLHNHKQDVRFLAASCNSCKRPYTYSRLPHTRHLDHSKTHKTNVNRPKSPLPKKPKNQLRSAHPTTTTTPTVSQNTTAAISSKKLGFQISSKNDTKKKTTKNKKELIQ
jgi:hypothetical protein